MRITVESDGAREIAPEQFTFADLNFGQGCDQASASLRLATTVEEVKTLLGGHYRDLLRELREDVEQNAGDDLSWWSDAGFPDPAVVVKEHRGHADVFFADFVFEQMRTRWYQMFTVEPVYLVICITELSTTANGGLTVELAALRRDAGGKWR